MAVAEPGVEQNDSRPLFPGFDAVDAPSGRADRQVRPLRILPAHLSDLPVVGRGDGLAARAHLPDEGGARGPRPRSRRRSSSTSTPVSGCMACVTACPSGVQYGPLVERTRAQIERHYPRSFADRAVPRGACSACCPIRDVCACVLAPLVILGQAVKALSRTRLVESAAAAPARAARARAARLVGARSCAALPEHTAAIGAQRLKVGLLTGCVQRLVFPQVNGATINVLAAEGLRGDRAGRSGVLRRPGAPRRTDRGGA